MAEEREVRLPGNVIGTVAENLHNNVGGGEYRGAIGDDPGALFDVQRVGITGLGASFRLHDDFVPGFRQRGNDCWNKCDSSLSGITFFRNSNDHAVILSAMRWVSTKATTLNPTESKAYRL